VAGYYVELMSAVAVPVESASTMPDKLKLRFFLKQTYPVFITVRERDLQHNYWMDNVVPTVPWHQGFNNEFVWPTRDVLKRLRPRVMVKDLAVVARLQRSHPTQNERVAPVVFYHSRVPTAIEGYMFTFAVNVDARFSCSVYRENAATPLVVENFPRESAGRAFTFIWRSQRLAEGEYRVVVKGKRLINNEDFTLVVSFYHQPIPTKQR
jgi:hypothetical protein